MEVLLVALKLGLTSFGGPVAHLGYFRDEYVVRRKWLTDGAYADLVALCQFLPGPASSQVGMAVGMTRAGFAGGVAAWLGFTLPSAVLLIAFGYGVAAFDGLAAGGWLRGLKAVAVAVVAFAVYGMARNLAPDRTRASLAIVTAIAMLFWRTPLTQVLVIAAAGAAGVLLLREDTPAAAAAPRTTPGGGALSTVVGLAGFFLLLAGLPVARQVVDSEWLRVFDGFYRAGALVFGGGHVVLPLLEAEVVPVGWVTRDQFIAGYGMAQAVPGPLFTFSAYLGTVMAGPPSGWTGGVYALAAIFLPSFLLLVGVLPLWQRLRTNHRFRAALAGINAAVVGLLLAALYDPVWVSAIVRPADLALALAAFAMLAWWKVPPWLVVIAGAGGGAALTAL
ncbi:MAG: chromate efflux transporter [Spirochaetaceae bacterium]|nr:chromate efflux transporter [Spirochaetaceae bacterium]